MATGLQEQTTEQTTLVDWYPGIGYVPGISRRLERVDNLHSQYDLCDRFPVAVDSAIRDESFVTNLVARPRKTPRTNLPSLRYGGIERLPTR